MTDLLLDQPGMFSRIPTDIAGFDAILEGGLLVGGLYMIVGIPGAGKTIFVNHLAFNIAARGKMVTYFSVFVETHSRLLGYIRSFSFFRGDRVGSGISYFSAYSTVRDGGLLALKQLIDSVVRQHQVSLVVLDGMPIDIAMPGMMGNPVMNDFLHDLQAVAEIMGCTVVITVPTTPDVWSSHAFLFVDGAFDLLRTVQNSVVLRTLEIRKFRGSTYRSASHPFIITTDGITLLP